jgi:hypothetical protein
LLLPQNEGWRYSEASAARARKPRQSQFEVGIKPLCVAAKIRRGDDDGENGQTLNPKNANSTQVINKNLYHFQEHQHNLFETDWH